jgi:hypothetical protein
MLIIIKFFGNIFRLIFIFIFILFFISLLLFLAANDVF